MSSGIGVERVFPFASPAIEKIELNKEGSVRRARIFYLRGLTGKKSRIKEKGLKTSSIIKLKRILLSAGFLYLFSNIKFSTPILRPPIFT